MPFKISVASGHPNYETLPAAKIISYPLAKEDYRPFAQARLMVGSEGLYLQMIAFEVTISPMSRLCASFAPSIQDAAPSEQLWIHLCAGKDGIDSFTAWQGETLLWQENDAVSLTPIEGEDLQGEYWGFQALIPFETFYRIWPDAKLEAGNTLWGNVFKICGDPQWEHYGSFFPADFSLAQPYGPQNFDAFTLVNY